MDDTVERLYRTEGWLRSLATDILEHEACQGCSQNAAMALEFVGSLEDTLERLGIEDPRETQRRRWEELAAQAAAGRPPRLRLELETVIAVNTPSQEMQDRIYEAVNGAVTQAVRDIPGATVVFSDGAMRMEAQT
jgi:hypothetical protein